MAGRRATAEIAGPNGRGSMPEFEDAVTDLTADDLSALDGLEQPDAVKATVYRYATTPNGVATGNPYFEGTLPPPVTPEAIQDAFGGGVFGVLFTNRLGRRIANKRICIAGPPRSHVERTDSPVPMQAMTPVMQTDPMMSALLAKMDATNQALAGLVEIVRAREVQQPNDLGRLKEMVEVVRAISGPPAAGFAESMKEGFKLHAELTEAAGVVGDGGDKTKMIEAVAAALPQIFDFVREWRAAQAPKRVVVRASRPVPPPSPLPTSAPHAITQEPPPEETGHNVPKWITDAAHEITIAQETDDPEWMADWSVRHIPERYIARWMAEETPLSVVRDELMTIAPFIRKPGFTLNPDFVVEVVRALREPEEETAGLTAPEAPAAVVSSELAEVPGGESGE